MNHFELYEQLLTIENIARQYQGSHACVAEIDKIQQAISSQQYRVAVIGEFKRGKSSLVNAIIGAEVLPTDILPMTAAVTRVTFGSERKILIRYKDGHTEEQTVEQLVEYATKYDEEKARRAATISEIEVTYPSVFCQNHIDIIDTPGLNDNETMTEVTLSVLGDVDAAIIVISASQPLSMTEKQLIVDLIGKRQIRHLIFAITHIDVVSNRPREQDKLLQFIKDRISGEVLTAAKERYAAMPYFADKAEKILSKPDLFGVSSLLAIEGFVQDDWELLEQSRFPHFKSELRALLTAAQSTDVVEKVKDMAQSVRESLDPWYQADNAALLARKTELQGRIDQVQQYLGGLSAYLQERFQQFDKALKEQRINKSTLCPNMHNAVRKMFIDQLAQIRQSNNTDETIRAALNEALHQADAHTQQTTAQALEIMMRMMIAITNVHGEKRQEQGFDGKDFGADLKPWLTAPKPAFRWTQSPIPELPQLKGVNVISHIEETIEASVAAFSKETEDYIAAWKKILRQRQEEDIAKPAPLELLQQQLQETEHQMAFLSIQHQANTAKMEALFQQLT